MFRVVSVSSTTPPTMIEPSEITKAVETIGTAGVVSTSSNTLREAVEPAETTPIEETHANTNL